MRVKRQILMGFSLLFFHWIPKKLYIIVLCLGRPDDKFYCPIPDSTLSWPQGSTYQQIIYYDTNLIFYHDLRGLLELFISVLRITPVYEHDASQVGRQTKRPDVEQFFLGDRGHFVHYLPYVEHSWNNTKKQISTFTYVRLYMLLIKWYTTNCLH